MKPFLSLKKILSWLLRKIFVINVVKTSSECTVRQEEGRQPAVQQDKEDVPKNTAAVQVSLN